MSLYSQRLDANHPYWHQLLVLDPALEIRSFPPGTDCNSFSLNLTFFADTSPASTALSYILVLPPSSFLQALVQERVILNAPFNASSAHLAVTKRYLRVVTGLNSTTLRAVHRVAELDEIVTHDEQPSRLGNRLVGRPGCYNSRKIMNMLSNFFNGSSKLSTGRIPRRAAN